MNNDIQNLVNELNSTTPKTQMYMIQLCRSAINNLYDLTDTIEENISSLQNSVVANTSAISGLQGSIDLINTNLNAYLGRIEALEDKTTNMSKLGNDTKFSNNVNVDGIITTGDDIISDGVIKGQVLVADNDQGEGRFAIDRDGDMSLYNPANAGKLITTGNISEYATTSKVYKHTITFTSHVETIEGTTYAILARFEAYSSNATPYTIASFIEKFLTGNTYMLRTLTIPGIKTNTRLMEPNAIVGSEMLTCYKISNTSFGTIGPDGTQHPYASQGNFADDVFEM